MNMYAHQELRSRAPDAAPGSSLAASVAGAAGSARLRRRPAERQRRRARRASKKAGRAAAGRPETELRRDPDRRPDARPALRRPTRRRAAAPIAAMPNTLRLIADKGVTFNRYYVPYPLCCPSRVSLLTGRYAHNHNVRGNVPPERRLHRLRRPRRPTPTTSPPGCRAPATARSTSASSSTATATNRSTTAPTCRPAGAPGTRCSTPTPTTTSTATRSTTTASIEGPYRRLRQLGNARIRRPATTSAAPSRRSTASPASTRPTSSTASPTKRCCGDARRNSPSTCSSTTPPRTATSAARPGPEPATAPLRHLRRRALPARPLGRLQRGQRQRQAALHPRSALPLADRNPHLPRLLPEGAGVAALGRRRRQADRRHARRDAPAAQHLHHLHLRQRLLLRRAPPHRRQVPRLRALDPPAVPDPRARDQAGQRDRRAGGQHRHRPDDPRTGRRQSRQKHRRALARAPTCTTPNLRTRRPILFESFVETNDVEENGGGPAATPRPRSRPAAPAAADSVNSRARTGASASIVAPPKNYYGIRLGPYKYIEWPDGEKELYDINKDPYELNNLVRDPNLFPIRAFLHSELIRLEACVGRTCQEVAAEIPADPRAAAQGRQGTARRRTDQAEGTRRTETPQRDSCRRPDSRQRSAGDPPGRTVALLDGASYRGRSERLVGVTR